jgi:methionyl-tRNA synthetase
VLSMVQSYCGGKVPEPGPLAASDEGLLAGARGLLDKLRAEFAEQAFHRALELVWQVVGDANRYVDQEAPWALRRTDPARLQSVLWTLVETVRQLAIYVQPVVPAAAARLLDQLAVPPDRRSFGALAAHPMAPGTALPKPEGIFPRFVEGERAG